MTHEKELKDLHEIINRCTLCSLHETRTKGVPGEGSLDAKLFFVGEAPGAKEDETGRPPWHLVRHDHALGRGISV